jgi:hypothetical protein
MSYKIEIVDEYGQWSNPLRFATEAEATECSLHFENAGSNGIRDLIIVPSEDPVNARWTEKGIADKDGKFPGLLTAANSGGNTRGSEETKRSLESHREWNGCLFKARTNRLA